MGAVALLLLLATPATGHGESAEAAKNARGLILFSGYGEHSRHHVYKIRADGTHKVRLSQRKVGGSDPQWSPDGRWIVYEGYSEEGLVAMRGDGSRRRTLTSAKFYDRDPRWSPDGRLVAFVRSTEVETPTHHVYVVRSAGGGGLRRVSKNAQSMESTLSWSPDGSRLSYLRYGHRAGYRTRLVTVPRRGGKPMTIVKRRLITSYDWAPDSSRIVFACMCGRDTAELYVIDLDDREVTRATRTAGHEVQPRWSPDGRTILFSRWQRERVRLFTFEPDGSKELRLTRRMGRHPMASWAPDSESIAFVRRGDIVVMRADGTGKRRLTTDKLDLLDPWWRPL